MASTIERKQLIRSQNREVTFPRFCFLALVLWTAFALRLLYVRHVSPFLDEYISMLAMQSILHQGIPVLPSGLFYGPKAIAHTYLGALFLWILGFSEFSARFPSVLAGVAIIACLYRVGRDWFSPSVGLLAALALTLSPSAVEWAGRARMYSLFQLLSLIGGYLLITGSLRGTNRWWGMMGVLVALLAVFTHALALIVVAASLAGGVMARLVLSPGSGSRIPLSRWEVMTGLILLVAAAGFWLAGPWGLPIPFNEVPAESVAFHERALFLIAFTHEFVVWPLWPLTSLYVIGFIALFLRLVRRSPVCGDRQAMALYLTLLFTWLATSVFASFHSDRYLFGIIPFYFLLVTRGLSLLIETISASVRMAASRLKALGTWGVGPFVLAVLLAPGTLQLIGQDPYGFAPAFHYVRDNWHSGDVVSTCSPAASQLFLGHNDYYVIQYGAETHQGVDIWTGSPLIDSVEEFLGILREHSRVWFVVERLCWEQHFDANFQAGVQQNMKIVFDQQGMLVFASDIR